MRRAILLLAPLLVLVLALAWPAVAATPGPIGLAASPPLLTIAGRLPGTVTVTNPTGSPIVVSATPGSYAINDAGRVLVDPASPGPRSASAWLHVTPARFTLAPNGHATVTVRATPPRRVTPGDHHALVLLATRAAAGTGLVSIRTRIGVGVLVRIKGPLYRELAIGIMRHAQTAAGSVLSAPVWNYGNVNERLQRGQVSLMLSRGGQVLARVGAPSRNVLPGTRGLYRFSVPAGIHGAVWATIRVTPTRAAFSGPGISKTPGVVVKRTQVTF